LNPYFEMLEFPAVLEKLKECALSDAAKAKIDGLTPALGEAACVNAMAETTAARAVLDALGAPPLTMMKNLAETVTLAEIGAMLTPGQLSGAALFAVACKRVAAYLLRAAGQAPAIAAYGREIAPLEDLREEIERCVDDERVLDDASPALRNLRRKAEHLEGRIKEKLNRILQSSKPYLADGYITRRGGHYVLPVQRKFQSKFDGAVIDASASGATVFMEPRAVAAAQAELAQLAVEEDAEERRILYTLSVLVADHAGALRRNVKTMETLDFLFAKAKLSAAMKAGAVEIGGERRISIRRGRHPLLAPETCVPLDFEMAGDTRGVIITGPNTGGKTVTLKTVGLLSLMAQCGLHVPCGEGGYIAMQDGYWCDIGDSQDISQNLSTFSGHMTNVVRILQNASADSLVLLDELGSGTDPAEGEGIAVAVLEELRRRHCMFLVTTHYPRVKTYAEDAACVTSARMAFDRATLAPLYRLEMGKSGESCALYIAGRLGLMPRLLEEARRVVYGGRPEEAPETAAVDAPPSRLVRLAGKAPANGLSARFAMGDSVIVLPEQETGIVYKPTDERGDVIVQVKGEKRRVKHTRLRLRVPASELYPPDYDFSIVFDTVENRKAARVLGKRYDPNVEIVREKDDLP